MITEFSPGAEQCTAVLTSHMDTGENFEGAISIGIYPDVQNEIWFEFKGHRINIQCVDVPTLCKQLKRAAKIATEQES
jgi:hypothetical protein